MNPEVRTDVVSLLVAVDWPASTPFTRMVRDTGEPFTAEETALIGSAGWAEIEAARQHFATVLDFVQTREAQSARLLELARPYLDRPGVDTLGEARSLMTDAEREELDALCEAMAPDGTIVVPTAR